MSFPGGHVADMDGGGWAARNGVGGPMQSAGGAHVHALAAAAAAAAAAQQQQQQQHAAAAAAAAAARMSAMYSVPLPDVPPGPPGLGAHGTGFGSVAQQQQSLGAAFNQGPLLDDGGLNGRAVIAALF